MAETQTAGGNLFTRKIGPLPGWAWMLLVAAGGYLIIKHKAASSSAGGTSSSDLPAGSDLAPPQSYSGNYSPTPPTININVPAPIVQAPVSTPTPIQRTTGHYIPPQQTAYGTEAGGYIANRPGYLFSSTSPLAPVNTVTLPVKTLPVQHPQTTSAA